ncbi:ROK family protein [Subtercola sp. PAMC28395]|uniref:ROK family protein n=1 Tax=Subtercola sp. PAMC28395 TaxID=2846775 RepID=UPI001C0DCDFF|nr:ROK family protein [Subtercola sp. PAMC28395]QWT24733.1 ROK family protein [Subtercola sp. PAMC28395]
MTLVLGVDIGGTKIAAGLVTDDHEVIHYASASTPASAGADAIISTVLDLAAHLRARVAPGDVVVSCGVGSAGVINPVTGIVTSATSSLSGWAGTPLRRRMSDGLGLPAAIVNDVHAHALGESIAGAGRDAESMLLIAAGTGIGGAIVVNGQLQLGAHGVGGHLGHIPSEEAAGLSCPCGRSGHLEAIASGPAIASRYLAESSQSRSITSYEVFERAERGDATAARVITTAAYALGRCIGGLVNTIDPERVVIGGGLAGSGTRWWNALTAGVAAETMPILTPQRLIPAALLTNAAVIGAAAFSRSTIHPRSESRLL